MSRPTAKEEAAEDTLLFSFSDELSEYLETTVLLKKTKTKTKTPTHPHKQTNKHEGYQIDLSVTGNSNEQTHKKVFVTRRRILDILYSAQHGNQHQDAFV